MKNSFSTFEIILVIIISSIVTIYSMLFIKELYSTNKNLQEIEINKLDMLSTKAFLQKQKDIDKKLKLINTTLYFEENILLKNIKNFNLKKEKNIITIDINLNNKIKQVWKFKI